MTNNDYRKARLLATATLIAGSGFAAHASAQSAEPRGSMLEEVVVTAQRRSENLQSVSIAVTSVSEEALLSRGVIDTESLQAIAPGLQYTHYAGNISRIFMRGIGTLNNALGDEPAIATYVDGVYMPSAYAGNLDLAGVERVEVLRGPQGTLFGRNAEGGVIHVLTKAPSADPALDTSVTYGNYDRSEVKLYANTPIPGVENLAVNVSAFYRDQDKGWADNLTDGDDVLKSTEYGVRAKLGWESDTTQLMLTGWFFDSDGNIGEMQQVLPGATAIGLVIPPLNVNIPPSTHQGFYNIQANFATEDESERKGASLRLDQDLGWSRLVAIGSLQRLEQSILFDQDQTPVPGVTFIGPDNNTKSSTAELQLLSPESSEIRWIGGLFYFHDVAEYNPLQIAGLQNFIVNDEMETESYSAFAQTTYPFTDRFRGTLGLRYTEDKRDFEAVQTYSPPVPANLPSNPIFVDESETFSKLTYRLSLDYDLSDDVLAYVSYNRGFKSGLYNMTTPRNPVVEPEVLDAYEMGVKSELFDSRLRLNAAVYYYEAEDIQTQVWREGFSRLLNAAGGEYYGAEIEAQWIATDRLSIQASVSGEHAEYTDFPGAPLVVPKPTPLCAPSPLIFGNCDVAGGADASGKNVVNTPEFTASLGVQYAIPTGVGVVTLNGGYYYQTETYPTVDNRVELPSYGIANASVSWAINDNVEVSIWGKNITDKEYYSNLNISTFGDFGVPAAPAMYGVTFRFLAGK